SGVSGIAAAVGRQRGQGDWIWLLIDGVVNVLLGLAIALQWPIRGVLSISLYVGLRYVSVGWSLLMGAPRVPPATAAEEAGLHPDRRLGLPPHPYVGKLRAELTAEVAIRNRSDRGWRWLFLVTFFAIHAARMDIDYNLVGMLSPAGAVLGDVLLSIVLAYGVVAPISVTWRALTRPVERRAWNWYLARVDRGAGSGFGRGAGAWWLVRRMRAAVRRFHARGSTTAALGWGLQTGLPAVAILMALTPLWGVSWFFNTETWVAAGWEVWAEQRTDTWRVEMVDAVR